MKTEIKEEFANIFLDALGIVILILAGYIQRINDMSYAPIVGVIMIVIGYGLVKGTFEYNEETELEKNAGKK